MRNKYEFSLWLQQKLALYDISEARLARAVGVGQKTINRYRNAVTCPDEAVQIKIESFFSEIESMKTNLGNTPYEIIDDELQDGLYSYDEDPLSYAIYEGKERLKYYTVPAQKFIVSNLFTFYFMEEYEFRFLANVRELSANERKHLIEKMESIPICMEMLLENDCGNPALEGTLWKMQRYAEIVRWPGPYPVNWHTKIDPKTYMRRTEIRRKYEKKYEEFCDTLFNEGRIIKTSCFFQKIERCVDYTIDDWYFLFLLARTRKADEADQSNPRFYSEVDGHNMKERESIIWNYLDMWLKK